MNLLACETSSSVGSVALETPAGVLVRELGVSARADRADLSP